MIEVDAKVVVDVLSFCFGNEYLCEVGINLPRTFFVGVGQSALGDVAAEPCMVEFGFHRPQTYLDIAERFFEGQLCVSHAQELIEARKFPQAVIAAIAEDTLVELVFWNEVHDLRENDPVGIHQPVLYGCGGTQKDYRL